MDDLAATWSVAPPFPNSREYSLEFASYRAERSGASARRLPEGVAFHDWFDARLPALEVDYLLRNDNAIVASSLLPMLAAHPCRWRVARCLHAFGHAPLAGIADFLRAWDAACPEPLRGGVGLIASVLFG